MMSSAFSMLSGGFSPTTTGDGAAYAFDFVKTWLTIGAEASAPLTFRKVRRFTAGLSQLLSLCLFMA
jgi:hypothetical protein